MSKMSEDLKYVLQNRLPGQPSSRSGVVLTAGEGALKEFPGFLVWNQLARLGVTVLLRSAKFKFAGAEPWKDGRKALEDTTDALQDKAIHLQMKSLAAGYQVGINDELKDFSDEEYDDLFQAKEFQGSIDLMILALRLDRETVDLVYEHLAGSVMCFANVFGLLNEGVDASTRVWDVWRSALSSNAIAMYMAGVLLGNKRAEEAILEGIKMATSQYEES